MSLPIDQKPYEDVEHVEKDVGTIADPGAQKHVDALFAEAANEELGRGAGVLETLKANPRSALLLTIVSLGAITNGIELSMSGSMLGSQAFCKTMGSYDEASGQYVVAAGHVSSFTAAAAPGQFAGLYIGGLIADFFGRRTVVLASMFGILLGAVVEVVSSNWKIWALSKAVMGVATGMIQAGTATYVAEVSPRELRGIALILFQLLTNVGNLLSAVTLDLSLARWSDPSDTKQYKIPLYIMLVLPVIIGGLILIFLVESPAWLVLKGRNDSARQALCKIYPHKDEAGIDLELARLQYTVEKESEIVALNKASSWLECFRGTDLRRTFVSAIPIMTVSQGGQVVFLLTAYFFSLAGRSNALQSTVIVQCTGILMNIVSIVLVENHSVGRWLLFMIGLFFQGGGLLVVGVIGSVWNPSFVAPAPASANALLMACIVIANAGMQLGPQPISWLYASETSSARLRAKTTAIGMSCAVVLGQISGVYFPYQLTYWGCKLGYFFGGFCVLFFLIAAFFIPDHTGRSLAQLDELYARRIPARKFAKTECVGEYGQDHIVEAHTQRAHEGF